MKTPILCSFAALALASALEAQQLQRVLVRTPDAPQVALLLEGDGFDVMEGGVTETSIELVVSPRSMTALMALGFVPEVLEVGRPFAEIQAERIAAAIGEEGPQAMVPAGYPDLAQIRQDMQDAAAMFPGICEYVNITQAYGMPNTAGNRQLFAVKISDNVGVDEDEPSVLVVSNYHAREITTPLIALYAIQQLTTLYGVDPDITDIVDGNEIWIAPTWNPDGYEYVFTNDNLWRKNRRVFPGGVGVDLNRNADFGWSSPCSGSSNVLSETYKGPSASSEVETMTMEAWAEDQRFTKVLDYHSFGREVLFEYGCDPHPLTAYLQSQAIALAQASGYGNSNRPPSANGEHYEWQLARYGNHSYLIETHSTFQPSFASGEAEAVQLWDGIKYFLELDTPISGNVTDAITGQPVSASITTAGLTYQRGETNTSDPATGRYHLFYPDGRTWVMTFSAPGYRDACVAVRLDAGQSVVRDVEMMPLGACPPAEVAHRVTPTNPDVYVATPVVVGQPATFTADTQGFPFATFYAVLCPDERTSDAGTVLIQVDAPSFFVTPPISGPVAQTTFVVTNDPSTCGLTIFTQAKLHGVARRPFVLTNAQDLLIGGM